MYTMILVDDEPIIQMGLRSILNYREYDIEITGVATDGEEALELIRHTSPDLVMMDINIPVINGLEVMEKVNAELEFPPLFIILSCHDEFRYAKKAVRLGALDYLLKVELTPDMLKETLQKAIRQLGLRCPDPEKGSRHYGEHASLTDSFFLKLLNNWFDTPQSLYEMASDLSIPLRGGCYVCIYFGRPSVAETISEEADRPVPFSGSSDALIRLCSLITGLCRQFGQCYATPWDFNSIAMILALPDTPSQNTDPYEAVILPCVSHIRNMVFRYQNLSLYAGIGTLADTIDQISLSFNESKTAFRSCCENRPVTAFSSLSARTEHSFHIGVIRKELTRALDNYDVITLEKILEQIPELILNYIPDSKQAIAICSDILHFIGISYKGSEHILDDIFGEENSYYSLYACRTPGQAADWFRGFLNELCRQIRVDFESKKNWLLPSILDYIEKHYMEPITLTDVSSCFNVSCGYISTIFKKHNGIGFTECVTQAKIRHAKELLLEPGVRIYDVASQLGYSDPYYFSKVFKKYTGSSPKEYMIRR